MRYAKTLLGKNGDWLYVSLEGPCSKCDATSGPQEHDLDLDFASTDQAYEAFGAVTEADGMSLVLEHAKAYYDGVVETQGIIRDKAKLLLGATSFTIGVFALATTVLKDSLQSMAWWQMSLIVIVFVVVTVHFTRALVYALVAITQESTQAVSTQEVIAALQGRGAEFIMPEVERRLAAHYRSAATQTNQRMIGGKTTVMLAQGCFKWGLVWLPVLVFGCLLTAYIVGASAIPRWAQPIVDRVDALESSAKAMESKVSGIENSVGVLTKATLDARLRGVEQTLAGNLQEGKNVAVTLQAVRTDLNRDPRSACHGEGRSACRASRPCRTRRRSG